MKVVRDRPCPQYPHVGRSLTVGAVDPRAFGSFDARLEVCDLRERVHAGVGATGRGKADRMRGDPRQRGLQLALHRPRVGLRLPAGKRRTVVFESDRDPRHRSAEPALRAGST